MSEPLDPEDCTTMSEVRDGVDEIDRAIVDLLALRFGYMEAAARIKADRGQVRDEARKADVLAKVAAAADEAGLDQELMSKLYEQLIEASIAYELDEFDRLRAG
jgi:isochorismate pyruvate lyase